MADEFVSLISHELRTPLTSVLGYLELVIEGEELPAERQREFLRRAHTNVNHLVYVLNSVHELSWLDRGGSPLELSQLPVLQLLREVADGFRPHADERELAILVGPVDDGLDMVTDRECLSKALVHLLSNACKYTPQGGTVRLSARSCNAGICVEITDTGIGIPPGEYDRVFTRFFRASNAREVGARGAGLGLAISKALVCMIRGEISFESETGQGTVFRVWLPTHPSNEPLDERRRCSSPEQVSGGRFRRSPAPVPALD